MSIEDYTARIREVSEPDILAAEDGYRYYFTSKGMWSADNLRTIADYLDELNKPWDDHIQDYFDKQEHWKVVSHEERASD